MAYLLTFEDGSSAHLSHHGVKGMKWGLWNEETKARYLGGKRGGYIKKPSDSEKAQYKYAKQTSKELEASTAKSDWEGTNVRLTNEVHDRLSDARKKLIDSDPLGQKYYSDPQLQKKYKEKFASELSEMYDDTPEGRKQYLRAVMYDDLDQGSLSAFSFESSYDLYVKDHVKDSKAYFEKQYKAIDEYRNAVKEEVSKVLGPYSEAYTRVNRNGDLSGKIQDEVFYQSYTRADRERSNSRTFYDPWEDDKLYEELFGKSRRRKDSHAR